MFAIYIVPALVLGFLGSFHCVGMCGPLALSLPVQHLKGIQKVLGIFLYNFGRVFTYALLGVVFGILGQTFSFFITQQVLSVLLGALLFLAFVFALFHKTLFKSPAWAAYWNRLMTKIMLPLFKQRNPAFLFLIGLLNGLLPCGLVYMAVAGAVATASAAHAALFMAAFGLGTLPAMAAISFAGNLIGLGFRKKIRKTVPFVMGIMGLLLILRGMNLNVPYLSPALQEDKIECCHQ